MMLKSTKHRCNVINRGSTSLAQTQLNKPISVYTRPKRSRFVTRAKNEQSQASVAVPQPSSDAPEPKGAPLPAWASASAAITAAATVAYLGFKKLQKPRSKPHQYQQQAASASTPPTAAQEEIIATMGPMILAAESSGGIDETSTLTDGELSSLDSNLRMLIQDMDAQLFELQDSVASLLPPEKLEQFDALVAQIADAEEALANAQPDTADTTALEGHIEDLQYKSFLILQPYFNGESEKRTYRSLLYNRSVQQRLQGQVERQIQQRSSSSSSSSNDGSSAVEEQQVSSTSTASTATSKVSLLLSAANIPHPKKQETGGEDAYFIKGNLFGIADGVGSWASIAGIDPAEYPRSLIAACEAAADTSSSSSEDPLAILTSAYNATDAAGSCTAVLASLASPKRQLRVILIGDCGLRVYRHNANVFQTRVQEYAFNQPYQLSHDSFSSAGNTPSDCLTYEVDVEPGDVIIAASDGLWDNVWDDHVSSMIQEETSNGQLPSIGMAQSVADRLATTAHKQSQDLRFDSPFSVEKQQQQDDKKEQGLGGLLKRKRTGGKLDDVTVIAAIVV